MHTYTLTIKLPTIYSAIDTPQKYLKELAFDIIVKSIKYINMTESINLLLDSLELDTLDCILNNHDKQNLIVIQNELIGKCENILESERLEPFKYLDKEIKHVFGKYGGNTATFYVVV